MTEATFQYNKLERLPHELSELTRLTSLNLAGNNWTDPPADVVFSGIPYILRYLRNARGGGGGARRASLPRRDTAPTAGRSSAAASGGRNGGGGGAMGDLAANEAWNQPLAAQHGVASPHERPRSSLSNEVYRYDHAADRQFLDSADPAAILQRAQQAGASSATATTDGTPHDWRPHHSPRSGGRVGALNRGFSPLRGGPERTALGMDNGGVGGGTLSQAVAATAHRAVPFPRALMRPGLVPPGLSTVSSAARRGQGSAAAVRGAVGPRLRRPRRSDNGSGSGSGGSSSFAAAMNELTSRGARTCAVCVRVRSCGCAVLTLRRCDVGVCVDGGGWFL